MEKTVETLQAAERPSSNSYLLLVPSKRKAIIRGEPSQSPCVVIADAIGGLVDKTPDLVFMFAGLTTQVSSLCS